MNTPDNVNEKIFETENKQHVNVLLISLYHDNDMASMCEERALLL